MPFQRVPSDIAAHYERVQSYQADAITVAIAAWREVSPARVSESWAPHLPAVATAVTSSQISASESAIIADGFL